MQIKYKNENKLTSIKDLRSGEVFLWDENAWIVLNSSECTAVDTNDYLCAKLSDGLLDRFTDDDFVLPMIQTILEVKE